MDGSRFGTSHSIHHNKGWKVGRWVGNGRMVRIGILRLSNNIPYVGWRMDGSRFGTSHNMCHNKGLKVGHTGLV